MSLIIDKLNQLIELKKISNYKIAKYLNVSPSTITNYRNGITVPNIDTLNKIFQFLGEQTELKEYSTMKKSDKENRIDELLRKIEELTNMMNELKKALSERDEIIKRKDEDLREKDKTIHKLIDMLQQKQNEIIKANR